MEQRNMILALGLSLMVMLGWGWLNPNQPQESEQELIAQTQQAEQPLSPPESAVQASSPAHQAALQPAPSAIKSADIPASTQAVLQTLSNDVLSLDMHTDGRLSAGTLSQYRVAIDDNAEHVQILENTATHSLYIGSGLVGVRDIQFKQVKHEAHNGTQHWLFSAELGEGQVWLRDISMQEGSYLIDINDRIQNGLGRKLFMQVVDRNPDKSTSTFYEHAGPIGFINDKIQMIDYSDLDETPSIREAGSKGWTGIMSRYYLASILHGAETGGSYYFKGNGMYYQAGVIDSGLADQHDALFHHRVFVGPKSLPMLESLHEELERSIDFGWFAFIAKPMHSFMLWMYQNIVSNYGLCIILLVMSIKLIFYPLSEKSYKSMAGMRKIQPEMTRVRELYGDDRQKMGQEMMALYKKHKVNPMSGCLPVLVQIPVFFALYKVLLMSIEMRQAPFMGWITDLSVYDPYFIVPVLMGASMFIQMKLNPTPPDPMQAKIMQYLPILFTVMFLFFPSGLVLYWLVNNILTIAQQYAVMKRMKAI